jgi:hypothetical protein
MSGERGLEMVYDRPIIPLLFSERLGFALWGQGELTSEDVAFKCGNKL